MQPFSRETIDRSHKLVNRICRMEYPGDMHLLNCISGYTFLCSIASDSSDPKKVLDAANRDAEKMNRAGIFDDETANKYMDAFDHILELWEPIKNELHNELGRIKAECEANFLESLPSKGRGLIL